MPHSSTDGAAVITSRQHPMVKVARSLHTPKGRREHRLFLAEGKNAVDAALAANWPIEKLLLPAGDAADTAKWSAAAAARGIAILLLAAPLLEYVGETQSPTAALALARLPDAHNLEFTAGGGAALFPVLDGISDPGNVGTLLRSADAAGASGVVLTAGSADPYSPKAVRASAGSLFSLPLLFGEPGEIVQRCGQAGVPIVIATAEAERECFSFKWPQRCAVVLGHETNGISPEFREAASASVSIPIYGRAESLNVAAAGAVMLYAWRQSVGISLVD